MIFLKRREGILLCREYGLIGELEIIVIFNARNLQGYDLKVLKRY